MRTLLLVVLLVGCPCAAIGQSSGQLPTIRPAANDGVDVRGALVDSLKVVMAEHAMRVAFQEKTRRELSGPFWSDYVHSVRVPRQWGDTDAWWVNYIGHPIHGAAAGYVWLDHDRDAPNDLSLSLAYGTSRAQAFAWAAGYSLQFEIGPLSEASIGNVGKYPETTGWVDHVVTPVGAFGLIVAEDALDRYLVRAVEKRVSNRVVRAALRMAFNPGLYFLEQHNRTCSLAPRHTSTELEVE